jgi:hypothetical protein
MLEQEEIDEINKIKAHWLLLQKKNTSYEHWVVGEGDYGNVSDYEVQQLCE